MTSISRPLCFRATTQEKLQLFHHSPVLVKAVQDFWDPISKRFRALLRDLIQRVSGRAAIYFDTSKICRSPRVGVTHWCVCFIFGFECFSTWCCWGGMINFCRYKEAVFWHVWVIQKVQTRCEMRAASPASGRQRSLSSLAWKRTIQYCTSLPQLWCFYMYAQFDSKRMCKHWIHIAWSLWRSWTRHQVETKFAELWAWWRLD